jgi:hypothetical protein
MMEYPKCEVCGELDLTCQTEHVGMCDDCFADSCREALLPLLGKRCCSVSTQTKGYLQICLAPYGVEHAHGDFYYGMRR